MGGQADIEKRKADLKQGIERLRGAIRMKVHPRDQASMLDAVDRIQETILGADSSSAAGNFQRGKDNARKILRSRPVDMVQILNELDGLEDEFAKLLQNLTKGH